MSTPSDNPYASPQAEYEPIAIEAEPFRDGGKLVVPAHCTLPRRCWVCNEPADRARQLKATGWVSFGGIGNVSIKIFMCENHRRLLKTRSVLELAAVAVIGGVALLFALLIGDEIAMLPGMIAIALALRWINVRFGLPPAAIDRVRTGSVWLKNAGEPFLESFSSTSTTELGS